MSKKDIIREIISRFRLDSKSFKTLEEYEYELIYETLHFLDRKIINESIEDFTQNKFKIKAIRTTFNKK